jgi:hypothetical protein
LLGCAPFHALQGITSAQVNLCANQLDSSPNQSPL